MLRPLLVFLAGASGLLAAAPALAQGDAAFDGIAVLQVQACDGCVARLARSVDGVALYDVDAEAAARQFLAGAEDRYDVLVIWTSFHTTQLGTAYYAFASNPVRGIGLEALAGSETFDFSDRFGSAGQLKGVAFLHDWWQCEFLHAQGYACDDAAPFDAGFYTNTNVVLQEVAHQWGSFVGFVDPRTGQESNATLGRAGAHWSYWLKNSGSPMEGNAWVDRGGGAFGIEPVESVSFSELDQYLMGVRPAAEVEPFLLLEGAEPGAQATTAPERGPLTVSATPLELHVEDVIARHGPRSPDFSAAPKATRTAWVLLTFDPAAEQAEAAAVIGRIRRRFNEQLFETTDRRLRSLSSLDGRDELPRFEFRSGTDGFVGSGLSQPLVAEGDALVVRPAGPGASVSHDQLALDAAAIGLLRLRLSASGALAGELTLVVTREDGSSARLPCWPRGDGVARELVFDVSGLGTTVVRGLAIELAGSGDALVRLEALSLEPGSAPDADGDRVAANEDRCPDTFDPAQADADGDGVGDACDPDHPGGGGGAGEDPGDGSVEAEAGCGCSGGSAGGSLVGVGLGLAAVLRRRRRLACGGDVAGLELAPARPGLRSSCSGRACRSGRARG